MQPSINSYSPSSEHESHAVDEKTSGQISHSYTLAETAGLRLPAFPAWPAEQIAHAEYFSLYPNLLVGIQADHVFAIILMPKDPARTEERLQLMYVTGDATSDTFTPCREKLIEAWKEVFVEDIFAVEGMQQGRRSKAFNGGAFSPMMDTSTHHFHCWVARQYQQAIEGRT